MIGKAYCYDTQKVKEIVGGFDSAKYHKFYIVFDEVKGADGFTYDDEFKKLVTTEDDNITRKNKDTIENEPSFCRVEFTTNSNFPIKISITCRRYLGVKTDKLRMEIEEVSRLLECTNNLKVQRMFYDMLMARDISNWNRLNYPITDFMKDLQKNSFPFEVQFLIWFLEDGRKEFKKWYSKEDLFNLFVQFVEGAYRNNKSQLTLTKFGITLKNLNLKGIDPDARTSSQRGWGFDRDTLTKEMTDRGYLNEA
jgi:hypothetical protein